MLKEENIQKKYYENTAASYEKMRGEEYRMQDLCLRYVVSLIGIDGFNSLLDVGCGTGRIIKYFVDKYPNVRQIYGIEPVKAMIDEAIKLNQIGEEHLICGSGLELPFRNASVDVVCEFATLHHVKNPNTVVKEMIRIAKKAIFLADSNRFGQGGVFMRYLKLFLYKAGLWGMANYIKTKGKGYSITEGDGLSYSYSVYDSYNAIAEWADRIILIPIDRQNTEKNNSKNQHWLTPLLTSPGILLCAFKD